MTDGSNNSSSSFLNQVEAEEDLLKNQDSFELTTKRLVRLYHT